MTEKDRRHTDSDDDAAKQPQQTKTPTPGEDRAADSEDRMQEREEIKPDK